MKKIKEVYIVESNARFGMERGDMEKLEGKEFDSIESVNSFFDSEFNDKGISLTNLSEFMDRMNNYAPEDKIPTVNLDDDFFTYVYIMQEDDGGCSGKCCNANKDELEII